MAQWISRTKCPSCGSSKGYNIHADGHAFCFSCKTSFKGEKDFKIWKNTVEERKRDSKLLQ